MNEPPYGNPQGIKTCLSTLICHCEKPFDSLRIDSATKQSIRFFASLRMTPCVRLLRGVYTEQSECARNDGGNLVSSYREFPS